MLEAMNEVCTVPVILVPSRRRISRWPTSLEVCMAVLHHVGIRLIPVNPGHLPGTGSLIIISKYTWRIHSIFRNLWNGFSFVPFLLA